jgi:thioredoxin reductase
MSGKHYDAIIVGGSYAGLSAALPLVRARRNVLVIDAGSRRNRFVEASHGFLGQDGRHPSAIAHEAREQLLRYPTAHWHEGTANAASGHHDEFEITLEGGIVQHARRLVLATGVTDELPTIDGLSERWGRSAFNCPYCDGYELQEGRVGVLASGPLAIHQALMLADWGQVTLFTNDSVVPDHTQLSSLEARGVRIEAGSIDRVIEHATVVLAGGRRSVQDGLFVTTLTRVSTPLAEQLGCGFEAGFSGAFIRVDSTMATTVKGVYACGDTARAAHSVAAAVGDGFQAGVAAHQSLVFG